MLTELSKCKLQWFASKVDLWYACYDSCMHYTYVYETCQFLILSCPHMNAEILIVEKQIQGHIVQWWYFYEMGVHDSIVLACSLANNQIISYVYQKQYTNISCCLGFFSFWGGSFSSFFWGGERKKQETDYMETWFFIKIKFNAIC